VQYIFDLDAYRIGDINDRLKTSGLYGLWDDGGEVGKPLIEHVIRIARGVSGDVVTFRVRFPRRDDAHPEIDGVSQDIDLRFQKDGSLVHGGVIKVFVKGALWEGIIDCDVDMKVWKIAWTRG
jgi:hypothetical protein